MILGTHISNSSRCFYFREPPPFEGGGRGRSGVDVQFFFCYLPHSSFRTTGGLMSKPQLPIYAGPILQILQMAKRSLTHLEQGGDIVKIGSGFGDLLNDTDIRADQVMGRCIQKAISKSCEGLVARVSVEGLGDFYVRKKGLWVCVDPIDGSLNYKTRGRTMGNPYTAVVTVLSKTEGATFNDVVFAAVLDLRPKSSDLWYAWRDGRRDSKTQMMAWLNDEEISTSTEIKLDPGSQVIMTETYYPANREKLLKLFDGQKGNYSRVGSAAYEMAIVSSGNAIAFICCSQKNHELGATQLLVRAAGGVAVDWEGNSIVSRPYDFRAQTPIILAANQPIADELVSRMRALGL